MRGLIGLSIVCLFATPAIGETDKKLQSSMQSLYRSYQELQPYLTDHDAYHDPNNQADITRLITSLRDDFHGAADIDRSYAARPGFTSRLKAVEDLLANIARHSDVEGVEAALWPLKGLSNHCVACHSAHKVDLPVAPPEQLDKLSFYARAEYYLIAREFEPAREGFAGAVFELREEESKMDAFRKWLLVCARHLSEPESCYKEIRRLRKDLHLSRYNDELVGDWEESFDRWRKETFGNIDPLRKAENLLRQGLGMDGPFEQDIGTVELLRAIGMLHEVMEADDITPNRRRRALYLLGLSYTKIPAFFVTELPEVFLIECMQEFPATREAKLAYQLYKELLTYDAFEEGETRMPSHVKDELKRMYDIAYGQPPAQHASKDKLK